MFDAKLGNCIYFLKEDAHSPQVIAGGLPVDGVTVCRLMAIGLPLDSHPIATR